MMLRRHRSTRSPRGARLRLWLIAIGLLAAWPAVAKPLPQVDDPEGPGPLPWRVRGDVAYTVDAASFPDSVGHTLEVYVRIPPATLASLEREGSSDARLKLTLRLTNKFGARQHEASQEFTVDAADSAAGFGKVVLLRFPVSPGTYRLRARVEDLRSRKRGLGYIGRKVTESATVEGALTVPGPAAGLDLSDPEFVWARATSDRGGAFRHGEQVIVPNPERLYGLLAGEVRVGFVARAAAPDERPWHWRARIRDAEDHVVAEQESTQAAAASLSGTVTLDASTHPAGGYNLEVSAWREGDPVPITRRTRFSIAWQSASWWVDPADFDDLVHFLLSASEEEMFARLHPGEREHFLDEFWKRRDPTPETAENEARAEFLGRIEHANQAFTGPGRTRGMFSDMGRVFIRYGEPDEVLKQVIPAGDQTLNEAIQSIELSEDRPTGDVNQKGIGGDQRPFEVWIYQGNIGAPPDADPDAASNVRKRRRLVFLFVDEHGYGTYTLRYTTE
jgi:GWxTD domain-containing protein